jgi:hypothetical protein
MGWRVVGRRGMCHLSEHGSTVMPADTMKEEVSVFMNHEGRNLDRKTDRC